MTWLEHLTCLSHVHAVTIANARGYISSSLVCSRAFPSSISVPEAVLDSSVNTNAVATW